MTGRPVQSVYIGYIRIVSSLALFTFPNTLRLIKRQSFRALLQIVFYQAFRNLHTV